jgi:hypothetical protein
MSVYDRPNRPPNPDGSLPAHAPPPTPGGTPDASATQCYPSGAGMGPFLDEVRAVIRNEWIRVRGGSPLDPHFEARLLNELMTAFSVGKVIPGYRPGASGACEMHWAELACFARWYSLLDVTQRIQALDRFTYGSREPWLDPGEEIWPPAPSPCTPQSATTEATWCAENTDSGSCPNLWCCPPEVYTDPLYTGKGKSDDNKWMAIGLGALAAATVAAVVVYAATPSKDYVVADQ